MRSLNRGRRSLVSLSFLWILPCLFSCGRDPVAPPAAAPNPTGSAAASGNASEPAALRDEIPPGELSTVMKAHVQGLGHMERYEYEKAADSFRTVHEKAPGWIPGGVNLAIALLNQTGNQDQASRGGPTRNHFEEALELLGDVVERAPENLHARYSRGIILEYLGRLQEAHRDFQFVADHDPSDAHALFKVGRTLSDPENPDRPAGPKQARVLIEIYKKVVELNPYLVSAYYQLQAAYAWAGDREKQKEVIEVWKRLNPKNNAAAPGETAENFYGEMGRYAQIIDPLGVTRAPEAPVASPGFHAAETLDVTLPEGDRWVRPEDFQGTTAVIGRAREMFGAAVATFDADGDGRADLFLPASVIGSRGVRDALLLNRGDGRFEDATAAFGLPTDRASLGVAAGDYDADRKIDLFLTGSGGNRLYHGTGQRFEDVTEAAGVGDKGSICPTARWLDLDQDGDLDLYVVRFTSAEHEARAFGTEVPPGLSNAAYRNDGRPAPVAGRPPDNWAPLALAPEDLPAKSGLSLALTPWPDADGLTGQAASHTAIAALDIDNDRDLDLVLGSLGQPASVAINDRLGRFHTATLDSLAPGDSVTGLLVTELDKDGQADLVSLSASGVVSLWRNTSQRNGAHPRLSLESWPADLRSWRTALAADLDLDTWTDLVGLPAAREPQAPAWARNQRTRLAGSPLMIAQEPVRLAGLTVADLVGDPLPDLVLVGEGGAPRVARNLGNGQHWLALELSGRWKVPPEHMRSNPHGLGTRITLEGDGLRGSCDHTTNAAGLAQSVSPMVLGMGSHSMADLLRLRWPDGTMQCELNVTGDKLLRLAEHNRKTGSCPVLFTWNGARFECLGDFLGGGGLGYLVSPGVYGQPDRDEAVAIGPDQLRAEGGSYRLVVTEPMDEAAYIDRFTLDVVDRPNGVSVTPDERFAPVGPRPSGALLAWRKIVEPECARDLKGRDVTETLRRWDRRTVEDFALRPGWIGYAEEHGIVLDFGKALARYGPEDRLVLCLAGWVEYPYSQTNYSAATAGVPLVPPSLERLRDDGTWETIVADAGYPAGLPRMTTLELTGKLNGPRCVIRLRTNMECYWDQAFLAVIEPGLAVRVTSLDVARAELREHGYSREVSPDGRLPLLYDYEQVDPAPLARMSGMLTRLGPVAGLLRSDDDRLCVIGPGDEIRLEFDARQVPALPKGWTRGFVLRAVGYCKDVDPFTALSDDVGPLPWKGMPAYPFGTEGERPGDPAYRSYLEEYQTRPAGDD